jgi:S-DNA-T family DNA segregation ATPase FtsK/SpoIIIE
LIKANFPSRISFGVTSQIDSRTILDTAGAEKLLGRGDMLFQPIDASRPERVQGVWISDSEVEQLVTYWQATPRGPLAEVNLEAVPEDDTSNDIQRSEDRDEMLDKVIELAQTQSKLSTSLLQRRLRIGYPRAARLMDQLEEEGIVGPSDGSKSRDVIITSG